MFCKTTNNLNIKDDLKGRAAGPEIGISSELNKHYPVVKVKLLMADQVLIKWTLRGGFVVPANSAIWQLSLSYLFIEQKPIFYPFTK